MGEGEGAQRERLSQQDPRSPDLPLPCSHLLSPHGPPSGEPCGDSPVLPDLLYGKPLGRLVFQHPCRGDQRWVQGPARAEGPPLPGRGGDARGCPYRGGGGVSERSPLPRRPGLYSRVPSAGADAKPPAERRTQLGPSPCLDTRGCPADTTKPGWEDQDQKRLGRRTDSPPQ